MNINKLKEIAENAPEGATHFDGDDYWKMPNDDHNFMWISGFWNPVMSFTGDFNFRSLEDIRTIIELYEGLQNAIEACYDLDSFGVRETNSDYINAYKLLERFE